MKYSMKNKNVALWNRILAPSPEFILGTFLSIVEHNLAVKLKLWIIIDKLTIIKLYSVL